MTRWTAAAAALALLCCRVAAAQEPEASPPPPPPSKKATIARFVAGGALGLGAHESGHFVFDVAFDAHPRFKRVDFGGIPFFALTHDSGLPARQEFTISSAGFWVQHGTSEWILSRHPRLRSERAPMRKGVLAFNVLASVAYGGAAFAHAGPVERDTRGMADSLGVDEAWVGAMLLVPAALDTYRYFRPQARWPKWASRAVKVGLVLLVLK
jgi:hypothetical protein